MELKVNGATGRIDKYLSNNTEYSRELLAKMITDGHITVNGQKVKPSYPIQEGDLIFFDEAQIPHVEIKPEDIPLDIVYEDDDLMVINKPSGLTVHPGAGIFTHTLVNGLLFHTRNLSDIGGLERPGIVHRLDKDTSGLMLVAKTNKAHEILAAGFKNKTIHRSYLALLDGVFPANKAVIDAPIKRDKEHFQRFVVAAGGKKAQTNLQVIKKYAHHTLVRLVLKTGRTHQIRVHMAYIGYPIFNDPVYNNKKSTAFGQFLHSATLEFDHPITGKHLSFTAVVPQEFADYLKTTYQDEEISKIA